MEKMPNDLRKALAADSKAQAKWKEITPIARRDFISWIEGAKQAETRARRVEKARSMLVLGKRRPCCYAVVPFGLYKALDDNAKAKATWKTLAPDARRDFTDWIDQAEDKGEQARRIPKACALLAAGKRRPR